MPNETVIKVKFDRNDNEEAFRRYPSEIRDIFRNRYLSHITTIIVSGTEYYSKREQKVKSRWNSVEAYIRGVIRAETCVISVKTSTGDFYVALEEFTAEVYQTGYRFHFDREDENTYNEQPALVRFFKSAKSDGVWYINVYYSRSHGGYVAHAYTKSGDAIDSVTKDRDKTGKYRVPFDSPAAAAAGLLGQFDRGRDDRR